MTKPSVLQYVPALAADIVMLTPRAFSTCYQLARRDGDHPLLATWKSATIVPVVVLTPAIAHGALGYTLLKIAEPTSSKVAAAAAFAAGYSAMLAQSLVVCNVTDEPVFLNTSSVREARKADRQAASKHLRLG